MAPPPPPPPPPFRTKVFLLRFLAAVFAVEFLFLGWSYYKCSKDIDVFLKACPKLGQRGETVFVTAIATTLSLLAGDVVKKP